jgi:hypothetical protein
VRLQALAAKLGLPALALLAGIGLSAAVGATYVTITHDSNVGTFNPRGVPMEDATPSTTTSSTTTTTLPVASTEVTQPPVTVAGTATTVRARATTTTTARALVQPAPTTTTACSNTGKGNCQSHGKGDPPGGPDD